MRYDDLIKPISPDAPCGPDLLEEDDDAFLDYYFNVEDRLPTSYYNLAKGELFDAKSVDFKAETAQIDALLKRSRDLRLLGLEAKFQILAGRFKPFVDAVLGMAGLLEAYPEDVQPRAESDNTDRRNALEELNTLATVINPLEYVSLMVDRRIGDITYRAYATGSGKIEPREEEEAGDASAVLQALGGSENATAVDTLHGQLTGLQGAIAQMNAVCRAGAKPFTPTLDRLNAKVEEILDMVVQARPDLGGEGGEAGDAAGEDGGTDAGAGGVSVGVSAGGMMAAAAPMPALAVNSHRAAKDTLERVERYFARFEPSALALVLVTQSRLLIGRPLVEALDVLLESTSERALIDFGTETGFSISMTRMRALSEESGIGDIDGPDADEDAEPVDVLSRDQAAMLLKSVEEFFRMREPASPIPILLFKARNMLNKDFHAIVRELLPKEDD